MHGELILAIDQGTTNTKVLLIDQAGEIVGRSSVPIGQSYPKPGWVEQDANAIWQSVQNAINGVLSDHAGIRIAAIGVTNQRESVTAWDRTSGSPLGPAIGWQCRRTAPFCDDLRRQGLDPLLRGRTGLAIDPLFSGSKMRWLIKNLDNGKMRAENGEICVGTIDSWLLWNLTSGKVHACDASNASRTQLFDIQTLEWDIELLEIFEVAPAVLPEVRPSACRFGETVALGKLPAGIPIFSLIGDSHAALFGHRAFHPGVIKSTYGTGSSLMTPASGSIRSEHGLSTTIAWKQERSPAVLALEGNIPVTGAAVQWLGEFLGLPDSVNDVVALAKTVDSSEGVSFVPAFVGLGAPYWNDAARGIISGLSRGTTSAHLAYSTLEAIAFLIGDVFEAMQKDAGVKLETLLADGGASRNDQLMQIQADVLGCTVLRNNSTDISALGAAYLAGLASDVWASNSEIESLGRSYDKFEPRISEAERKASRDRWKVALESVLVENTRDPIAKPNRKGKSYGTS
jgi:glycerol kinase